MSDWNDEPRLSERRASAPEVPRHRSRKDRRRWCRGRVGVEHELGVRVGRYARGRVERGKAPCHSPSWRPGSWWCNHERYCVNCGKIVDASLDDACPDRPKE